jgi:hypothetical protein
VLVATRENSMKMMAGNSNRPLAEAIAAFLNMPLVEATIRRFSDMEVFVEIQENMRGEDVFLMQSASYPANDNVMELLICIDPLKRASARRITAVIPYFGYARQDRKVGRRSGRCPPLPALAQPLEIALANDGFSEIAADHQVLVEGQAVRLLLPLDEVPPGGFDLVEAERRAHAGRPIEAGVDLVIPPGPIGEPAPGNAAGTDQPVPAEQLGALTRHGLEQRLVQHLEGNGAAPD